jgi:hypothetical protein
MVVLPAAAATGSREAHAKYGWVNHVVQNAWLVARIMLINTRGPPCQMVVFFAVLFFWKHVSLQSLSMLLFNHVQINCSLLLVWHLVPDLLLEISGGDADAETRMRLWCPLVSTLMIALFCYRRCRPLAELLQSPVDQSRCAELLERVLAGGAHSPKDARTLCAAIQILRNDAASSSSSKSTLGGGHWERTGQWILGWGGS